MSKLEGNVKDEGEGEGEEVCDATIPPVVAESTTDTRNTNLEMSGRFC